MNLTSVLHLIEETLTAAAFAEENEHETALSMLGKKGVGKSTFCSCATTGEECFCTLSSAL